MPSYTTSLRLIQPSNGEYPGDWGNQVNNSLTAVVDKAVAGTASITMTTSDYTLTNANGAADEAKSMFLVLGGTPGAARNVICPAVSKLYYVTNNTTGGFAQTVKTASGSGISVPNGASMVLRCDGTDVVVAQNYFASLSLGSALPTASGGTGLTSFTANGVTYASSSSALATGSALTFDGTNFSTTGTATATKLIPTGNVVTGNGMYLPATNTLAFSTNGTEALRIDASRNLGLDGTSPSAWFGYKALQSQGSALYLSNAAGTFQGGLSSNSYLASAGSSWTRINTGTTARYDITVGIHKWYADASGAAGGTFTPTERMQLDNSGNLGLDGTSPSPWFSYKALQTGNAALYESGTTLGLASNCYYPSAGTNWIRPLAGSTARYELSQSSHKWYSGDGGGASTSFTPSERMRMDGNGYLLIGYTTSNGAYNLQVNSQIFATSSTIATSDGRYKTDVTSLTGCLADVMALNPVQFRWKEHSVHNFNRDVPTVGFIAQEVQQVLADRPYLASVIKSNTCTLEPAQYETVEISPATDDTPAVTEERLVKPAVTEEFLGIAEGNLIALLTAAMKEQQALITALTARVTALEAA